MVYALNGYNLYTNYISIKWREKSNEEEDKKGIIECLPCTGRAQVLWGS